jgi:arsenate reductase (thioredoxin)
MPTELDQATRAHIRRSIEVLSEDFAGIFSRETINAYVEESIDQFSDARVEEFVPLMVERFSRQRLRALAQAEGKVTKEVPEVLFVCVHNSGRSQMAAGVLDKLAEGRVHVRSAGSDPADELNPNAVRRWTRSGSTSPRSSLSRSPTRSCARPTP